MKIHFYLRYRTQLGESFSIILSDGRQLPLEYLNDEFWHTSADVNAKTHSSLGYRYIFQNKDGDIKYETDPDRSLQIGTSKTAEIAVFDYFNPVGAIENVFATQPFRNIFSKDKTQPTANSQRPTTNITHVFRTKAPLLKTDEVPCLAGHGNALHNWSTAAPILLTPNGEWWEARLDLSKETLPLGYKYGVWNTRTHQLTGFEEGSNRLLISPHHGGAGGAEVLTVHHDNFARFPFHAWKGAGVAIPVFSLRSHKSWGVGEFADMHLLVDWAKSVGLKIIQLLPINDTTANHTWTDSYPYSAVSAFALHPIFLNTEQLAGKQHAEVLKPFLNKQKELNALEAVDYEAVLQIKWDIIRRLYDLLKADWLHNKAWLEYYASNKHWLAPYAAFCWLRDMNGTADAGLWSSHTTYKADDIEKLLSPKSKQFDQIAIHLFVQWHLHLQLKAAVDYAHANGIALKGDIPIGIYRYSCDAWMAPELYNMDKQAGAPPDDFAEKGQNWGFPTYNWARMKKDGFSWWRQRFEQMRLYFDAFRIDHILGFFRIWSIPLDAVEGILGQFVPAIPVAEKEFHDAGIGFNHSRLCTPYITERVLWETFGEDEAAYVRDHFLAKKQNSNQYSLKTGFDTQRKVETWYNSQVPNDRNAKLRDGLFTLISNVLLFQETKGKYHFRFGIEKTTSFQHLPEEVKEPLKALYVNYFYRRQDDFWKIEAMEKLPELKRSTNMLICGEDLGMVPHCVPDVMKELGILSLEIQRMPKATGTDFFHPKDAPYLSVVTPSTHDMSTIRGWWEEDRALSQRFFNEMLGYEGTAPWFCEPWLNRAVIAQHFNSPAMWSIFQLQDLLGSDEKLRRENPHDERINVPANPKHYWRYRMHIALEDLMKAEGFNKDVKKMVEESGRT
ncbi:MAG TPA: 4-alpha-glucanotransferase [Saprospiraceae bacterium]|nr:4-alpha-glucanotransferase [Saprospiraceae bacterium]